MSQAHLDQQVSQQDFETALRISPLLYDAVLDESRWPVVLQEIADFCEAPRGASTQIFQLEPTTIYGAYAQGFSDEEIEVYLGFKDYINGDPRFAPAALKPRIALEFGFRVRCIH